MRAARSFTRITPETPDMRGEGAPGARRRRRAAPVPAQAARPRRGARDRRAREAASRCRSSSTTTSSSPSRSARRACIWGARTAISARRGAGSPAEYSASRATTTSSARAARSTPAPTMSPSAACSLRPPSRRRCARRSRSSRVDAGRAAVRDRRHHARRTPRRRSRPVRICSPCCPLSSTRRTSPARAAQYRRLFA